MLQPLRRLVRPAASTLQASAACRICACKCGATFGIKNSNVNSNGSQIRHAWATKRKSPAALDRARDRPRNSDETSSDGGLRGAMSFLARRHKQGFFSTDPEQVMEFIRQFRALEARSRGGFTVDPKRMREIMDANHLVDKDSWNIPHLLMATGRRGDRYTGKKMLLSMSRAGVEEATIRVMAHAVLESKKRPEKLNANEIHHSRLHLSQVASEKRNFRAMVCEGKVARALGDEERAIEMWTDAMAAAIEDAEQQEQTRRVLEKTGVKTEVRRDPMELSTPWIELMLLHRERSELRGKDEMKQCRWAMEIGCKQDDPTSFYHASTFVKQYDSSGNHMPTSEWLYYVTKAASSAHPVAAYQLAKFYAESGWKYLEDEPPDHVKPTPFDSFPVSTGNSFFNDLLSFIGLKKRPEMKAEESLFHNAVFPSTAADRYAVAFEWLDVATRYTYAPAYLYRAQLLMQKTLWGLADAPQAAVNMSADRYSHASKEAYEAGVSLEKAPTEEPADPPNPHYNLKYAQVWLREVFYAHEAYYYSFEAKKAYTAARRRGAVAAADDEDDILVEGMFGHHGFKIQKWFRFPEIREMYEDELEGLYTMAKRICDEQGWNIYDDDSALIYKAGSGQKRAIGKLFLA
ncbi:hypothetical protein Slin15195_G060800 [Septoria linicola]|uniref:Uncharacterized protein n=1 Tax=Septoria linicola TaxID=215465 RepID=A0A9Q9AVU9_9PEZI|nr:hypothetical protein Slin15195_G060800 [Septoria linicola]